MVPRVLQGQALTVAPLLPGREDAVLRLTSHAARDPRLSKSVSAWQPQVERRGRADTPHNVDAVILNPTLADWQHVDASLVQERRSLNLFLAIVLFLAAAIAFVASAEPGLTLGLALSGLLIVLVILASAWVKLSLHASFAAFAVVLLWPLPFWFVAIAALAAASICWSRVLLARHTVIEVVAGSLLGAIIGACFWIAVW